MSRLFALSPAAVAVVTVLAASTMFAEGVLAAPEHARVRGTVASISAGTLTVHGAAGDSSVSLSGTTKYLKVARASLGEIEPGSYIGTATKSVGGRLIALEVVVFPPAMKGTGDGHYDWDALPDTTTGGLHVGSSMTNGSVASVSGAPVKSSMTNGSVQSAAAKGGATMLTVAYQGGSQKILVPPTAPIVKFEPGAMSDVTPGASVFVNGTREGGTLTAGAVAVGVDGVKPPM